MNSDNQKNMLVRLQLPYQDEEEKSTTQNQDLNRTLTENDESSENKQNTSKKEETPKEKNNEINEIKSNLESRESGRWTNEEHLLFLEGLVKYGNEWKSVQNHIKTRTATQARSHAQKYFIKLRKDLMNESSDTDVIKDKLIEHFSYHLKERFNPSDSKVFVNKLFKLIFPVSGKISGSQESSGIDNINGGYGLPHEINGENNQIFGRNDYIENNIQNGCQINSYINNFNILSNQIDEFNGCNCGNMCKNHCCCGDNVNVFVNYDNRKKGKDGIYHNMVENKYYSYKFNSLDENKEKYGNLNMQNKLINSKHQLFNISKDGSNPLEKIEDIKDINIYMKNKGKFTNSEYSTDFQNNLNNQNNLQNNQNNLQNNLQNNSQMNKNQDKNKNISQGKFTYKKIRVAATVPIIQIQKYPIINNNPVIVNVVNNNQTTTNNYTDNDNFGIPYNLKSETSNVFNTDFRFLAENLSKNGGNSFNQNQRDNDELAENENYYFQL